MGMDPIQKDEVYEVLVHLEGPLDEDAYYDYRKELDKFVKAIRKIKTTDPNNTTGPKIPIKARELKTNMRPKNP